MTSYPELKYATSRNLCKLIGTVAKRASEIIAKQGKNYPHWKVLLDLEITHCNGCELDLVALAKASPFEFTHDVFGIIRHLNRTTGQLEDGFVPRFAYVNHVTVAA